MIRIDCTQGSDEWRQARASVITASNAHKLVSPKTGKPSAQATDYAYEIIAEEMLGQPLDSPTSSFMQRGHDLEAEAREWYEFENDVTVEQVGFLLHDNKKAGCSPDGLVGEDGGLEIKCPAAATHVSYLLGEAGEKYRSQIQFCLWITGRQWWDFVSWNPELPPVLVRFHRDEAFIESLSKGVDALLAMLVAYRVTLRNKGVTQYADFKTDAELIEQENAAFVDDLYAQPPLNAPEAV